jgi:two-component system sensor histidine kinase KdpD
MYKLEGPDAARRCPTEGELMPPLRRKTPEELLREVQAEEETQVRRGRLKIFLGYASGVGKSFRMLDEARRRCERGQDVAVAAVQALAPPDVGALLCRLEMIPLKYSAGQPVIDMEAVLRRHPAVCVIDGLAYDNPPGSRHPTRWEDVQELLDAGISVISSINVQYVAELAEQVEAITGKRVAQTVPMHFIKSADEIVIVDTPPEEPLERSPEQQAGAAERERKLSKLREITLILAADVVDHQLNEYLQRHGIEQSSGAHERILVCVTPRANIQEMVGTAHMIAEKFHAELIAAYVNQPQISNSDQAALNEKLEIARQAGATVEILDGEDPVEALLEFARVRGITQLFIGHSQRSGWWSRMWGSPVDKLIRRSQGMDVRIFPQ